ncbi:MAG: radical SAM protein [FCB group bacterium]|nr:radical SAM protein [FCB group bacterium]
MIIRNDVRCGENQLDNYPPADRSIYYKYKYLRNYPTKPFITGRGCPYLCTFCFNRDFNQMYRGKMKILRRISPQNVIAEITGCKAKYPLKKIFFNDDIFIMQKDWLEEFAPLYRKEIGIPYACNVRANLVDEDRVKLLKESGCYLVMWGIESGDEKRRREILGKNISDEQIRKAAALFRQYGIKMKSFNIMGSPGETLEEAVKTIKLNAEVKIDYPWCSILQPYPRTKIAEIAEEQGVLKKDYSLDDMHKSFFANSVLNQGEMIRIERLQKLFYLGVKLPGLIPLFTWMTKYPLGLLFKLLFGTSFLYRFAREVDIPLYKAVLFALRHRKSY